ncbi:MAG: zinc ribbon domain-containing protein [Opitutales bacterium]|nr:zinc ribbon domain-containing protein [Opitutales bacterium]
MITYVYESIPEKSDIEPELFEIQQSIHDVPLTKHPETGKPIRRVILGGYGVLSKTTPSASGNCGPGCCCG